jgi:hypothetical protein
MKKSLYNIEEEYLKIANQLSDGELTEELETALMINEQELQSKAIAYAYVIKDEDADVSAIDDEIKRLQAIKKAKNNKIKRLKDTIHRAMDLFQINEVKIAIMTINFRRSEGVICTDTDAVIPEELCTVVPETKKPNLTKIKAALKADQMVEGYEIEERFNLQIK